jgi:type I restriction enzyme S subunit
MNAERLLDHYARIADAPDAIPRVRRFILDLAARGKLTPYAFTEDDVHPLGELSEFIMGQAPPGNSYNEQGVGTVFVKVGEFGERFPNRCAWTTQPLKFAKQGDVLICVVGATIGKLNLAIDCAIGRSVAAIRPDKMIEQVFLYYSLMPITLRLREDSRGTAQGVISRPDLASIQIWLPPLAEQQRIVGKVAELMALCDRLEAARARREATRDRLAAASLARLNAPDPDTYENDARFALNVLPALTTRPDQIKQLRQTMLNLAVRGKLVPQDPNDEPASELLKRIAKEITAYSEANRIGQTHPEPIADEDLPFSAPLGWQWTRLCALFNVITDGDHQPPPKAHEGVAFLTIGNITTGRLDFTGCRLVPRAYFQSLAPYRTPAKGDILYTVVGATFGRPAAVETDRDFCVQRHIAILKPVGAMDLRFLVWLLASPMIYDQASRSTTGTAQPTIALRPLRSFVAPLPPLAEQHRIVAKVDELMALCDRLEASLASGEGTRRRLLDALLAEALEEGIAPAIEAA